MKFDVAQCECGAATSAVRALVGLFESIDWFVAPRGNASSPIDEHLAAVRAFDASAIPARVEITHHVGGWPEFRALAATVRQPSSKYDWKFGTLKRISKAHASAKGWTIEAHVRAFQTATPRPGDLFLAVGGTGVWIVPDARNNVMATTGSADSSWYLSYARVDLIDAIEWQLVEASADLAGNPFVPLLRCYEAGQYPFALAEDRIAMFCFGWEGARERERERE